MVPVNAEEAHARRVALWLEVGILLGLGGCDLYTKCLARWYGMVMVESYSKAFNPLTRPSVKDLLVDISAARGRRSWNLHLPNEALSRALSSNVQSSGIRALSKSSTRRRDRLVD